MRKKKYVVKRRSEREKKELSLKIWLDLEFVEELMSFLQKLNVTVTRSFVDSEICDELLLVTHV